MVTEAGSEVTNLGFNSNPKKPKNRELLNTTLKEAFEYATPRQQLIDVVFGGHAEPWANIMSAWSGPSGWLNPAVKPLPYDPDKANQMLDSLGYPKGSDGIRQVPATTGQYAQPAHEMSYDVIVPGDLDFNGDRQFEILQTAYKKIGVKLNEIPGGDVSLPSTRSQQPTTSTPRPTCSRGTGIPTSTPTTTSRSSPRPSGATTATPAWTIPPTTPCTSSSRSPSTSSRARSWCGRWRPTWRTKRPYIQLVNTNLITAHSKDWTGFQPQLWSYCKCYYTSPHPT